MDADKDSDSDIVEDIVENLKETSVKSSSDSKKNGKERSDDEDVDKEKQRELSDDGLDDLDLPFRESNEVSDLRLIVEGKPLYVSRVVLSLVSPVMKRLFRSKEADDTVELELEGKKYGDIVHFLSCVYPNVLAPITADNVDVVLSLADEFEVKNLMHKCELFLVKDIEQSTPKPTPEKIVHFLDLSDKYGMDELQRATFETAARTETGLLENVQEFWDLPSVTTTSVFIRRLKLLEKCWKNIRNKIKELQNHCSLYHKGDRSDDSLCSKCCASIGKFTTSEVK